MTDPATLAPWHHFYEASESLATLPDQGSVGNDAVHSTNGSAGFVWDTATDPWPVEKWQDGINTKYLVTRIGATYSGPLSIAGVVKSRQTATLFAQILTTTNQVFITKGVGVNAAGWEVSINGTKYATHPELRDRWSLIVVVIDGPNSLISENGHEMAFGGPAAAQLAANFALMGVNNAWSNMTPSAFRWGAVYQGALSIAQRNALYAYGAAEGLDMETPTGDGAATEAQAKVDETPDGGTVDLADKVYVQEVPLQIDGRHDLTILGPRLQAFTTGADQPIPPGVDGFNWPRSRSHVLIQNSTNITLVEPDIKGPGTIAAYTGDFESQAGVLAHSNDGLRIIRPHISNVLGDGLELWDLHTTVVDPDIDTVGRQGISASRLDGLTVIGGTIRNCGRSGIDIEPYTAEWSARNIILHGVTVSDCANLPLAMGGTGPIDNVDISECDFDTNWLIVRGTNTTFTNNRAGFRKQAPDGQCLQAAGEVRMVDNYVNVPSPTTVAVQLSEQATETRTWTNGTIVHAY